jgi:Transglycosylase-like domain
VTPFRRTVASMTLLVAFVVAVVIVARAYGAGSAAADAPLAAGIRDEAAAGYWIGEFRRRWAVERRDGRARARTIRRLRAVLTVRALRADVIGGVWVALARCESGANWAYNGSSGFDGGLQFHPATWSQFAPASFPAWAWQASPAEQVAVARRVLVRQGWAAWPACSSKLGLR